ncbi:MAG TPA: hypothetical protein VGX48_23870 [Pyrinomonadaceae bacterium]|jgi:hypothetical protein|nr:hypothetical protein [Pyrinomonadaceae bacterium]
MADFNTGTVTLDFRDAARRPIKDNVRLTFDNLKRKSLSFRIERDKFPLVLNDVPAFPDGNWTVFVQPERYRPKTFFINLASGGTKVCEEFFFLHSAQARPVFPSADAVFSEAKWADLAALLKKTTVGNLSGQELFSDLVRKKSNHLLAGGLLNLHARSQAVTLPSGKTVFSYFNSVDLILQDRIYAMVSDDLHADVLKSVKKKVLEAAPGNLHEFHLPSGDYTMLKKDSSFKTPERVGNMQLTFAENDKGKRVVDADVDEAKGIKHAFEVLSHVFTGGRTHPYDIHQILTHFYEDISLGYDLVPA